MNSAVSRYSARVLTYSSARFGQLQENGTNTFEIFIYSNIENVSKKKLMN